MTEPLEASFVAQHDPARCRSCGACFDLVACAGSAEEVCAGCGACVLACPNEALTLAPSPRGSEIGIEVDGRRARVPFQITIREALTRLGYKTSHHPSQEGLCSWCRVGGCWACAVLVDGQPRPACVTMAREGMKIDTRLADEHVPRRVVSAFQGHTVGGVGTPWDLRRGGMYSAVEVACFTAGCNFRCPQCQNWRTTFDGASQAFTPEEAAAELTSLRRQHAVDRMTFTGGECTLNGPWLTQSLARLRELNPGKEVRLHVDTNGSLLTPAYIDRLVEAGMTDVGPDLKAYHVDTFMKITGVADRELAQLYRDTAWEAVRYVLSRYGDRVFIGVGIPYNKAFVSLDEIELMGRELCKLDPQMQVCVNDYRPEYRSRIVRPTREEMLQVHRLLQSTGLKTVVTHNPYGFFKPTD